MESFKFFQFLQDDRGQFSATRLAFLLWAIGLLVVWTIGSLNNADGALLEIPNSVIIIISAFMTGKVIQKHAEKSVAKSAEATDPVPTSAAQQDSPLGLSRLDTHHAAK